MSTNEIAGIDSRDFSKRVADHVVNTIGGLIPEEKFRAMVDAQIKAFFESSVEMTVVEKEERSQSGYGYSKRKVVNAPVTPFQQMVWKELMKLVEAKLDEYMKNENAVNPVNKLIEELFKVPEFENHQVLTTQQLLLAMAGRFFSEQLQMNAYSAKSSIAVAFMNAGMPDVGNRIMSSN